MSATIDRLREATYGTEYQGRLYLVGGVLRDRVLGLPEPEGCDLVLEGDALKLAQFLYRRGVSDHHPVLYPRFGTAMISVGGHAVELVTARAESYDAHSRKPRVARATLQDDVLRRDFTINTLLENLHTGEELDLTGLGRQDLAAGLIRTPLEPRITFYDDPLRMLRAIRFSTRFGFQIEERTWRSICSEAGRLDLMTDRPPVVSAERIRDEFLKIICGPMPDRGLEMLRDSTLLQRFLPELTAMVGVTQNNWHCYDVWDHTLAAIRAMPPGTAVETRLGVLLHDVAKPVTRTEDARGIHFYDHPAVGAGMARTILRRLKLTNHQIQDVATLVQLHMRLGDYRPELTDAAVRRLIREAGPHLDPLFTLTACDQAAMAPDAPRTDLAALRRRIEEINRIADATRLQSPLDGQQIMEALGLAPGPAVRSAKQFLTDEVIEGRLAEGDVEAARELLRQRGTAFFVEPRDQAPVRRPSDG